jgi:hypothetical protein
VWAVRAGPLPVQMAVPGVALALLAVACVAAIPAAQDWDWSGGPAAHQEEDDSEEYYDDIPVWGEGTEVQDEEEKVEENIEDDAVKETVVGASEELFPVYVDKRPAW